MHSSSFDSENIGRDGGEVLVAIATLVTEGRIPGKLSPKTKGFYEGPHCIVNKNSKDHKCDLTDVLCSNYESVREHVLNLWKKNIPLCIEVVLTCSCQEDLGFTPSESYDEGLLLEKWFLNINHRRSAETTNVFNFNQLISAIRSQLYFSQLTAWLSVQDEEKSTAIKITKKNIRYRLTIPGETFQSTKFTLAAQKHEFPITDVGNGKSVKVSFLSLPRVSSTPKLVCNKCDKMEKILNIYNNDQRFNVVCTQKGKHRCEDFEEVENFINEGTCNKKMCQERSECNGCKNEASTSKPKPPPPPTATTTTTSTTTTTATNYETWQQNLLNSHKTNDLNNVVTVTDKGKLLLDAIERSGQKSTNVMNDADVDICDKSESDIFSIKKNRSKFNIYVNKICDSSIIPTPPPPPPPVPPILKPKYTQTTSRKYNNKKGPVRKLSFDDNHSKSDIPTVSQQLKFRKDLDNAANMVFHSGTGLPLTSSPAPIRRGKSCFDFDSTINSVSAIKSALFPTSFSTDDESESDGSIVSPCSPEATILENRDLLSPVKYRRKGHAANLLGSFEESVLNGRLEPVSTVHGFTAELGASGSFVPKHLVVPVTVFFYTLGDNDKVSSPYLSHINLGKKGYNVPKSGTIQVTLFNPLGTVVKMFVILYDLNDMPPNSQTFLRQRTLYMPANCKDEDVEWGPKWLRFLIHLRFMSSKSGKIYLHSDIRMIIFRKSDLDTATAHGVDMSYELRSFTHMPANPRFSPRK